MLLAINLPTPPKAPNASFAVFKNMPKMDTIEAKMTWKIEITASKAVLTVEKMTSKIEVIRSLMEEMTDVILVLGLASSRMTLVEWR